MRKEFGLHCSYFTYEELKHIYHGSGNVDFKSSYFTYEELKLTFLDKKKTAFSVHILPMRN